MKKFNNCVAVVTGAGSGIGRQLAYQLANAGAQLAISDIDSTNLDVTRLELEKRKVKVLATTLDVADQDAVFDYAEQVSKHFNKVNLVINNAGVALGSGPLWDTSIDDLKWLMDINFYGVVYGTKAFYDILEKAEWGHIVNISSLFGLISVPNQTAYNASKFAVRGFSEAFRQELVIAGSHISCTSVHPGGIKTNIARSARVPNADDPQVQKDREKSIAHFDTLAGTTPEQAARQILKGVVKNKARVLIGKDAKLLDIIQRVAPQAYPKILNKLLGDAI